MSLSLSSAELPVGVLLAAADVLVVGATVDVAEAAPMVGTGGAPVGRFGGVGPVPPGQTLLILVSATLVCRVSFVVTRYSGNSQPGPGFVRARIDNCDVLISTRLPRLFSWVHY